MGKDTGGNRKKSRAGAGAGAAPQEGPVLLGTDAANGLALNAKESGKFTRDFAQDIFGTTKPKQLREDHGVKLDVDKEGTITMTAFGYYTSNAKGSLNTRETWLNNYASANGMIVQAVSDVTTQMGFKQSDDATASRKFKVYPANAGLGG